MEIWMKAARIDDIPVEGGGCLKFGDLHIALLRYGEREFYAVDNVCPHRGQSVISRGLMGDSKGEPKVVCPLHKASYSLKTGGRIGGELGAPGLTVYAVKLEGDLLMVKIPESAVNAVQAA